MFKLKNILMYLGEELVLKFIHGWGSFIRSATLQTLMVQISVICQLASKSASTQASRLDVTCERTSIDDLKVLLNVYLINCFHLKHRHHHRFMQCLSMKF